MIDPERRRERSKGRQAAKWASILRRYKVDTANLARHLLFLLSVRASRSAAPSPRRTSAHVASALSAHAGHTTAYATGNANPPRHERAVSARWYANANGDVSSMSETSSARNAGVSAIASALAFIVSLCESVFRLCEMDRHTGASATVVGHASGKLKNVTAAVAVAAVARATHFNVTQGGSLRLETASRPPPPP